MLKKDEPVALGVSTQDATHGLSLNELESAKILVPYTLDCCSAKHREK